MSKEGWRTMLMKGHAEAVSNDERSTACGEIDQMAMEAFDAGYDYMKKHNDNGNAIRGNAFTPEAVDALKGMFEAGMLAFIEDKEAS